ncbi:hypothetical protein P3T76_007347 [Phytophthora citrophthora]|uniref:Uncharacterized protein n=1 Tax=Phytophthora citrophthora TaxID=4793 RepID=A0AAD9LMJ4_9STRA|nr:hypothetical protein P3T76_007347 [Phytophthora citrophthora]
MARSSKRQEDNGALVGRATYRPAFSGAQRTRTGTTGVGAVPVIGAVQRLAHYKQDVAAVAKTAASSLRWGQRGPSPGASPPSLFMRIPTANKHDGRRKLQHVPTWQRQECRFLCSGESTKQPRRRRRRLPVRYGGFTPVDRRSSILKPSVSASAMASVADPFSKLGDPLYRLCTATLVLRDSKTLCVSGSIWAFGAREVPHEGIMMQPLFPDGTNSP